MERGVSAAEADNVCETDEAGSGEAAISARVGESSKMIRCSIPPGFAGANTMSDPRQSDEVEDGVASTSARIDEGSEEVSRMVRCSLPSEVANTMSDCDDKPLSEPNGSGKGDMLAPMRVHSS